MDGRDIEESTELALKWNSNAGGRVVAGGAEEYRLSETRSKIVSILRATGEAMTPTEMADPLDMDVNTIKQRLWRMSQDGQLFNESGKYRLKRNLGNPVTDG